MPKFNDMLQSVSGKKRMGLRLLAPIMWIGAVGFAVAGPPDMAGFLDQYCVDCHDGGLKKGGLDLEMIAGDDVLAHMEIWEKAVRRMEARQMPPPRKDRPDEEEYRAALAELTDYLDAAAEKSPDPGHVDAVRRMTRTEYQNVIRDLLGVTVDVSELLPKDESSHGFDNITVGSLSPTLLNRYISAAEKISRVAVGSADGPPQIRVVRMPADQTQEEQVDGLPLGTRGGALIEHTFPVTGEYQVEVRLARDRNEEVEGLHVAHDLVMLVDREEKARFTVKPPRGTSKDFSMVDAGLKSKITVTAGTHDLGVTFVRKSSSLLETKRKPYDAHYNMHRHPRRSPAVYQVSITGPFGGADGEQAGGKGVFVRIPASEDDETPCAVEILTGLMRKAYRRPVGAEDLKGPMGFYQEGRREGGFEHGIEMALTSILVSPRFLFKIEEDPAGMVPGMVYQLDGPALASRLSFFLWSSLPDDELLKMAETGGLADPETLGTQVLRMLADPRARALATNFAEQWLQLKNLDGMAPDLRLFPDFDDNLRQSFKTETELFFRSIMAEDRSVVDLLRADYTFLNERLAKHYGIPHVFGSRFRRVTLDPEAGRGGLLRQGGILMVTSYANRTSPVIRGNWILDKILGTPPPPPPPDIPALDDAVVSASLPMRERLAAHRQKKSCATCHDLMDPVGFSLENYDAVGHWREKDGDVPVDVSGGLPDGQLFNGVDGLEEGLLARRELFARTLTEKLLTYALGRGVEAADAPAVRRILKDSSASDYRFSDIILGIAKSVPFTQRKAP